MKLYVKIKDGKIVESSPTKIMGAKIINCTKGQQEQIREQFTAYVEDDEIKEIKAEGHRENYVKQKEEEAKKESELKAKKEAEKPVVEVVPEEEII